MINLKILLSQSSEDGPKSLMKLLKEPSNLVQKAYDKNTSFNVLN